VEAHPERKYRVVRVLKLQGGGQHERVLEEDVTYAPDDTIKRWTAKNLELDCRALRQAADAQVLYFTENAMAVVRVVWEIQTQRPDCTWVRVSTLKI
jgi:hypothetical protein